MTKKARSNRTIAILIILGGVLCGGLAGSFLAFTRDLPQIRSLESYMPSATTRVYSSDNVLLAEFFTEKRDPVSLTDIPSYLKEALIATEDRNFYRHSGVDVKGILRAIVKDIMARDFVEGASTITQQLSKTLFLTPRKTLDRKIKEAILAFQLERRYTKDEILTLYLNQVYFGSGAYGAESAAKIFFGKSVAELTLSECALIAGMPKAPSRYSPLVNPELALKRRNIVLKQMLETGLIQETEYLRARKMPVFESPPPSSQPTKAPYFVSYIKDFLEETVGAGTLYKGGLSVYTTLSFELQTAAEESARKGVDALAQRMKNRGISDPDPQCALVSLDVPTGGILAMVGGKDFRESPFNRAVAAKRQPGSAFKPIIYAYAVEHGFSQNMLFLDAPIVFKGALEGEEWRPENYSQSYQGEMTMRTALARSKNIPTVRLLEMLGPSPVIRFAYQLGIGTPLDPNLSLGLGTSTVRLIDLTAAYRVFASGGEKTEPFGVMEVLDHSGRMLWRAKPGRQLVLSAESAAVTTDMLQAVVQEGTGRKALSLGRPVAGKTGTTDEYKDALFVGYSPSITTGVWVGLDRYETLGDGETGAVAALPIWIGFMEKAMVTRPFEAFGTPPGTIRVSMDPISGNRVKRDSPDSVLALFREGMAPK